MTPTPFRLGGNPPVLQITKLKNFKKMMITIKLRATEIDDAVQSNSNLAFRLEEQIAKLANQQGFTNIRSFDVTFNKHENEKPIKQSFFMQQLLKKVERKMKEKATDHLPSSES
jgi:thiamine biosynthesis lipoprotein ApbE